MADSVLATGSTGVAGGMSSASGAGFAAGEFLSHGFCYFLPLPFPSSLWTLFSILWMCFHPLAATLLNFLTLLRCHIPAYLVTC